MDGKMTARQKRLNPENRLPMGRPPRFSSPEEFDKLVDKYFKDCPDFRPVVSDGVIVKVPTPTISGLALYLGFCDRFAMYDYEVKPNFTHSVKRARAMLTRTFEILAHLPSCAGAIFLLKNLGYTDKTEIDSRSELTITIQHQSANNFLNPKETDVIRNLRPATN